MVDSACPPHSSTHKYLNIRARKILYSKMDTGKYQFTVRQPTTEEEYKDYQKVLSTLRNMDTYAKHVMTKPSVPHTTRQRCQNTNRLCVEWASQGFCTPFMPNQPHTYNNHAGKDDVVFMMNNCPLACTMCEELDSFHKCAGRRHPMSEPSFWNGELSSYFYKQIDFGEWDKYEPRFVSYPNAKKEGRQDDPHVIILNKFLTDEEADHLKALGSSIGWNSTAKYGPHASNARCHENDQCNSDETYRRIMNRIATLTDSTPSHLEPMEILRLTSSSTQQPNVLQHNFDVSSLWTPVGPRVLSLSLFLSSVSKRGGGGIGFPCLNWLQIKPRKGMAVLWANVKSDDLLEPEPLTTLEYFPVKNGGEESFISNVHVRMYNWTDASVRGCG